MSVSRFVALLEPLHKEGEELANEYQKRPQIRIDRHQPVILGKNRVTQIKMGKISRKQCQIEWDEAKKELRLVLLKNSLRDAILISGKLLVQRAEDEGTANVEPLRVILKEGDEVTLYREDYAYRVEFLEGKTSISTDDDIPGDSIITQETLCPICLEILVRSTILSCGHIFCYSCLNEQRQHRNMEVIECSLCRNTTKISEENPLIEVKTLDTLIWKLVEQRCHFPPDDVQSYLERDGREFSEEEKRKLFEPRKRQRTQTNTGSSVHDAISVE